MDIDTKLKELREQYKMIIPIEYEDFIKETEFFDYADSVLRSNGMEIELNHFLKVDDQNPSRDVLMWYAFAEKERLAYLTIAMGYGNEEIAIKVSGADAGGVYYIDQTEEVVIKKLFENFDIFKKQL